MSSSIATPKMPDQSSANRVATEAIAAGRSLEEAAASCPELREAMDLWGAVRFGVTE